MSDSTAFSPTSSGLCCDGVPLADIARSVGTPVYVYSADRVRKRYAAIDAAFNPVPHSIHYALKANSTLALVRVIKSLGASVDANSGGEIEIALRAGFIPPDIVFTGVGKSRDELERAVVLGLKAINVESSGELDRIDAIARAHHARARVALRVNPDVDAETHAHISTGLKRNKFGIPIDSAADIWRAFAGRPGLQLVGLHAHIGSQIQNLEPLRKAARALATLARSLQSTGSPVEHLDLGGGLGIAYDGNGEADIAAYGAALIQETRELGVPLILEPGRWLVGPAGALLATVVDVKPAPEGRRFVVLDAGMTELIRPALYGAFHRIVPVIARAGAPDVLCDIVGPVCESSDSFGRDRSLQEPRVDDLLAILDAGAYGAVMASNYNRRPQPPEVLVDRGTWKLIRRRQTIEEQLACEP